MAKRKAKELGKDLAIEEPRRSSRKVSTTNVSDLEEKPRQPAKKHVPVPKGEAANEVDRDVKSVSQKKSKHPATTNNKNAQPPPSSDRQYWLMKAEPESRLEKGHDIKFSIDDLAAKTVPEPWDGIRAYPARNNIRAMKKGDLAFFYHSSCKVPAIVGTMEIVQEHSPDLSAHDPSAPYYDAKSTPEDPKWSVVHVEFRQKLETPITLRELKDFQGEKGNPLENMQMLKLSRLSVSKVSAEEWEFLTGVMRKNGDEIA
ncbi:PUA-like domain-containing protein [Bisporella sp. PMI_857]|nr:PUA-like domain-containing protein [Bisporella sp. PMI_857]